MTAAVLIRSASFSAFFVVRSDIGLITCRLAWAVDQIVRACPCISVGVCAFVFSVRVFLLDLVLSSCRVNHLPWVS